LKGLDRDALVFKRTLNPVHVDMGKMSIVPL
jgi:hypothetical protein